MHKETWRNWLLKKSSLLPVTSGLLNPVLIDAGVWYTTLLSKTSISFGFSLLPEELLRELEIKMVSVLLSYNNEYSPKYWTSRLAPIIEYGI